MKSFLLNCLFCISFCLLNYNSSAQIDMKTYEGNWESNISNSKAFNPQLSIKPLSNQEYEIMFFNKTSSVSKTTKSKSTNNLQFDLWDNIHFTGTLNNDQSAISGFIKAGITMFHVQLNKTQNGAFVGNWNVFMIDELINPQVFLSIEEADGEHYVAYPFLKDQRFTGTWAAGFKKKDDQLQWFDFKSGLQFRGQLKDNSIEVDIHIDNFILTSIDFKKSKNDWAFGTSVNPKTAKYIRPNESDDGWKIANPESADFNVLKKLSDSIYAKAITHTHSVVVAKKGKLVFEKYYSDYNVDIPHDQRSASKSISSALIGIAIDKKIIPDANQSVYNYIPNNYQYTKDSLKSKITLQHLLTMSSGLDAVDFGTDRKSAASEDSYQNSPDWIKTVLEAPMIHTPGAHANYGSANPFLLGVALSQVIDEPLELFIDQQLLAPLGITNYVLSMDLTGQPYFGGGMYLTPRDMLKFGQLYLNKGTWNGKQIISKEWINASIQNYKPLENTTDKNGYGYLWWHKTYQVSSKDIQSIEARGAGGQYITLIPELDLVIAITSGNYRNGRFWQPEKIIEDYILPAFSQMVENN